jgi:hypothetical protein
MSLSRLSALALALLALATPACQFPFLPEIAVGTSDTTNSFVDGVAIGKDGDFVVVWEELDGDRDILARRFDRLSVPLDDPFPVNVATASGGEDASIARDASGRSVVVWADGGTTIWGRRFDADGTPLGDSFQVNTTTPQGTSDPHVASDPSGSFVVAWTWSSAVDDEIKARRFDSHGAPLADEFPVNAFTTGDQRNGGVAMSPAGFVVTWAGAGSGTANGVFARLFDPAGDPLTTDLHVHTAPPADLTEPKTSMDLRGNFVVVWQEGDDLESHVVGRRYDASGSPQGAVFPVNSPTFVSFDPKVASDAHGNFVVAWRGTYFPPEVSAVLSAPAGVPFDFVGARLYDIVGNAASDEFQVNEHTTSGYESSPRVSLAGDGSFVVAWTSYVAGPDDVVARKTAVRAAPAIPMDPDESVSSSPRAAAGNGVFEPGETQVVRTAWANDLASGVASVEGSCLVFSGPPGATYTLNDDAASYDTLVAGQSTNCIDGGDCCSVTVSVPVVRPAQHWDARLQENLSLGIPHTWVVHLGESFPDVPTGHQFYAFIETLFHNEITGGCAGGGYCPANPVTRSQMAVFLLKSKFGSAHIPPPCTGTVFADVPCTGGAFDPWIEELAALGITGGCGPGLYCPGNPVTRQQMAVFLLKTLEGSAYDPPDCAGLFGDVPCTPGAGFSDWIEELYDRGITGGCSMAPLLYCPTNPNDRGQMAVFLVKTFGLVLYGG